MPTPSPPQSIHELMDRVEHIAGLTLAELARKVDLEPPGSLRNAKGWTGQLIERCLGASAGSRAEPDFPHLGIELKTIPLTASGQPKESTYVCTVPLAGSQVDNEWSRSWVRQKLNLVLWLPLEANPELEIGQRRIGSGILCHLTERQDRLLRQDWEEHMELIRTGRVDEINAHQGTYLQVRPKAADSSVLSEATNQEGERIRTLPRGFYLRTAFTAEILAENFSN